MPRTFKYPAAYQHRTGLPWDPAPTVAYLFPDVPVPPQELDNLDCLALYFDTITHLTILHDRNLEKVRAELPSLVDVALIASFISCRLDELAQGW